MKGLMITLEGVEGSGKSTQIQMLAERLAQAGLPVELSKEPGGTPLGQEIRRLLLTPHASGESWCALSELLLFYADRAQHLAARIRPALESGKLVLVDRFEDSTHAYQGASGVPDADLERLRDLVLQDFRPDLTLILDMDPRRSLERVSSRNAAQQDFQETRFDQAALDFHQRVRTRFQDLARRHPERIRLLDADRDPKAVATELWGVVSDRLRRHGFGVA